MRINARLVRRLDGLGRVLFCVVCLALGAAAAPDFRTSPKASVLVEVYDLP